MTILIITSEYIGETPVGGLATYTYNISRLLAERENDVIIVTASLKHNNSIRINQHIILERVYVNDIRTNGVSWINNIKQSGRVAQRVKKIQAKYGVDVIHYPSELAIGLLIIGKTPKVARISTDSILCRESKKYNYLWKTHVNRMKIEDLLEYISLWKADSVFGPGQKIGRVISARIHKDVQLIESPFLFDDNNLDNSIYQAKLEGKRYLLTHSSLSNTKGILLVGECIYEILKNNSELYYVFAGIDTCIEIDEKSKMSAVKYIKKNAKEFADRVIYLGSLRREQLFPVILGSYACILPSRIDNFPNSCVESMALGKIVIGTRGGGCEQLITDGENGLLIKIDSKEDLVKQINYVLKLSDNQYTNMCKAAKKRVGEMKTESIVDQLLSLYKNTINSK